MKIDIRKEHRARVEAGAATRIFMEPKEKGYPGIEPYKRFCRSKSGYLLYLLGYRFGWHTHMIFDPLGSGSFFGHIRGWLYNLWKIDIYYPIMHCIDTWRRPEFYRQRQKFMSACWQAQDEGMADKMPAPPGFPEDRFTGIIFGERYFRRVAEILKDEAEQSAIKEPAAHAGTD